MRPKVFPLRKSGFHGMVVGATAGYRREWSVAAADLDLHRLCSRGHGKGVQSDGAREKFLPEASAPDGKSSRATTGRSCGCRGLLRSRRWHRNCSASIEGERSLTIKKGDR